MTPAEAIAQVRGYAAANRIQIGPHAKTRMGQRGVTYRDLRNALEHATRCVAAEQPGRWRVTGPDLDAEELTTVVVIHDGVVVVTVF